MPLIHSTSKEAFNKNVAKEVEAGKPIKQAVAIAYSVKRAAKGTPPHSVYLEDQGSAYEHSVAHTKQDFHTGVRSARMKSTKDK